MGQITFLGTAAAVANEQHENSHLAIRQGARTVLVDCPGSPVPRLARAGIELDSISDLVLTHFHPDHVSGAPILLMDMWLLGRQRPLRVHGLAHTVDRFESMLNLYDWTRWPGFFPVEFHRLPEASLSPVLAYDDLRLFSSPVKHLMPTMGLRVEFLDRGKTAAYSCDTEPSDEVARLAQGADALIHEATGAQLGHSSAAQAGEIGRRAGAKCLYLIHYDPRLDQDGQARLVEQARQTFGGPVVLALDFLSIDFS